MKKIIPFLVVSIALFSSCDKIQQDDFLQGDGGGSTDTTSIIKKILIEEFTGFKCKNCPEAAIELQAIENLYEGKIVGIGIHAGFFATPSGNFTTDFRTEAGNELEEFFSASISGLPIGMVNRLGHPNSVLTQHTEWASIVSGIINNEPSIGIKISESSNQITVEAKQLINTSGNLKLVVCITEDHIIDKQLYGNDLIEDYEHNHVLRKHLNGTWGTDITLTSEYTSFNFDYTLENNWVRNNCNVIAYVYNDSNKEVLQVEKIHLTN